MGSVSAAVWARCFEHVWNSFHNLFDGFWAQSTAVAGRLHRCGQNGYHFSCFEIAKDLRSGQEECYIRQNSQSVSCGDLDLGDMHGSLIHYSMAPRRPPNWTCTFEQWKRMYENTAAAWQHDNIFRAEFFSAPPVLAGLGGPCRKSCRVKIVNDHKFTFTNSKSFGGPLFSTVASVLVLEPQFILPSQNSFTRTSAGNTS